MEVGNQLVWRRKRIGTLPARDMAMIPLTALIVVAYDADPVDHIHQPVLESVTRPRNRFWHLPERQLGESRSGIGYAGADKHKSLGEQGGSRVMAGAAIER